MDKDEIRKSEMIEAHYLREIAVQLAELNNNFQMLAAAMIHSAPDSKEILERLSKKFLEEHP